MMKKTRINPITASAQQQALILSRPDAEATQPPKRLVLIHGAGIGGELTWTFLCHYLEHYDEILIPDLAGMGKAYFLQQAAPQLDDYLGQLDELIAYLNWPAFDFDVAGYSFGGMLTERWLRGVDFQGLCFLMEPAMLFSADCKQILHKAQGYAEVADVLLTSPLEQAAYVRFLDQVSPERDRSEQAESLIVKRLQANPKGFAQALLAITASLNEECDYFSAWQAPWAGASFVGGLSWAVMHQRHKRLSAESPQWHYETIANADHSLVFTRPRGIAQVMNTLKARQLGLTPS